MKWQGQASRICCDFLNYKTKQEPLKQQVLLQSQSIVVGNKHSDRNLMVLCQCTAAVVDESLINLAY